MKIAFVTVLYLMSIAAQAQSVYVCTLRDLYRIDIENCSFQYVVAMHNEMFDIAFHPNGKLYGVNGSRLYEIDTLTGETEHIHTFSLMPFIGPNTVALTIAADGTMYVLGDLVQWDPIEIKLGALFSYRIDQGISVYHGLTGHSPAGDLTFYKGDLYAATIEDRFIKIDITNPANSSVVIDTTINQDFFGIVSYAEDCAEIRVYAFTDLVGDVYQINIEDGTIEAICNIGLPVTGGASTFEFYTPNPLIIETAIVQTADCNSDNGSLMVQASGGEGLLMYSLNGIEYQLDGMFSGLSPGDMILYVMDERGCSLQEEIHIPGIVSDLTLHTEISHASCGSNNGRLVVYADGGQDDLTLSLNGGPYGTDFDFDGLGAGMYTISVAETNGCISSAVIEIDTESCSVYIPNIFSPNNDGINDYFGPVVDPGLGGVKIRMSITDRWGDLLFEAHDVMPGTIQSFWNGIAFGKPAAPGVYVYVIEIENADNSTDKFWGDLTLVR